MENLIIVGAGGFGREIVQLIEDINHIKPSWRINGFIDDDITALDSFNCDYTIMGRIKDHQPTNAAVYACAIANPFLKANVVTLLKSKGAKFISIIHPSANVGSKNYIGEGFVAYPNACVTTNVVIGNFVTLLASGVGHDAEIGDFSTISSFCDITGGVKIGRQVFLGSHVTVVPGKKIGDEAFVCAGSVVVKNIRNGGKVFGNPAKQMPI